MPENLETPPHRTMVAVRTLAEAYPQQEPDPIPISDQEFEALLGSFTMASSSFVARAENQVANRAQTLFETSTPSPEQGIKTVFSHRDFGRAKGEILEDGEAMGMIDRALGSDSQEVPIYCTGFPMKVFNPLETEYQGNVVDLGDVSVLLRFAELAEALTHFGSQIDKKFSMTVVSDGRMNAGMFKVDPEICDSYIANLNGMIDRLGISSLVSVQEFFRLLESDTQLEKEYEATTQDTKAEWHDTFNDLLCPHSLSQSIESALQVERREYGSSSFGQLFHSTIGSVRLKGIERLSEEFGVSFLRTYAMILESILWDQDLEASKSYSGVLEGVSKLKRASLTEALMRERSITMQEAWHSTIEYIAVLAVNRATNALDGLFPNGIRVTTRPKKGQIGIHTSDQSAPTLFSYHSIPVILPCNKGRNVKLDFQLRSDALVNGHRPVTLNDGRAVCYTHPDVSLSAIDQLPWRRGSK